jgi:nucleoside-diphosphate kinase
MLSGPICAMVWEGRDAVKTGRGKVHSLRDICSIVLIIFTVLLGATNPLASAPGTIRGDFAIVSQVLYFNE